MDRRCRWVLPVDVWTGRTPPVGNLPRTWDAVMAFSTAQWLQLAGPLRLDIRPTDSLVEMRGQYGYWLGVGYDIW
jgi:hypothetical protein